MTNSKATPELDQESIDYVTGRAEGKAYEGRKVNRGDVTLWTDKRLHRTGNAIARALQEQPPQDHHTFQALMSVGDQIDGEQRRRRADEPKAGWQI